MKRRAVLATTATMISAGCVDQITSATSGGKSLEEIVNSHDVSRAIHAEVNRVRTEQDLPELELDDELADIAKDHSDNMVEQEFFAHEAPNGSDFEDRYQAAGYNCRVSSGPNQYYSGAENIGYTWADQDVQKENGESVNHDNDEDSIGKGIVRQWVNSPPHRENILRDFWSVEGIGVAVDEDAEKGKKVVATQNFC